jgi:outer membrane immunogenic protein
VVGGGVEYGLTRNWSVKAEYLYMDFGNVSSTGVVSATIATGGASLSNSVDLRANIIRAGIIIGSIEIAVVRVGLNYQFH